jgi:hypothetical protein
LGLAYRLDRPAGLLVASLTLPRADQRGNCLVDVRLLVSRLAASVAIPRAAVLKRHTFLSSKETLN